MGAPRRCRRGSAEAGGRRQVAAGDGTHNAAKKASHESWKARWWGAWKDQMRKRWDLCSVRGVVCVWVGCFAKGQRAAAGRARVSAASLNHCTAAAAAQGPGALVGWSRSLASCPQLTHRCRQAQ